MPRGSAQRGRTAHGSCRFLGAVCRYSPASCLCNVTKLAGVCDNAYSPGCRRSSRHHPDKLAARGLPDRVRETAEERSGDIRTAYHLAKAACGM